MDKLTDTRGQTKKQAERNENMNTTIIILSLAVALPMLAVLTKETIEDIKRLRKLQQWFTIQ